jgi:hypothetical protein
MSNSVDGSQPLFSSQQVIIQGPNFNKGSEIDDTIEAYLQSGNPFEFTHNDHSYSIILERGGGYVAYDKAGNVVDPNVQINTRNTVDGFIEVRGLY